MVRRRLLPLSQKIVVMSAALVCLVASAAIIIGPPCRITVTSISGLIAASGGLHSLHLKPCSGSTETVIPLNRTVDLLTGDTVTVLPGLWCGIGVQFDGIQVETDEWSADLTILPVVWFTLPQPVRVQANETRRLTLVVSLPELSAQGEVLPWTSDYQELVDTILTDSFAQ